MINPSAGEWTVEITTSKLITTKLTYDNALSPMLAVR